MGIAAAATLAQHVVRVAERQAEEEVQVHHVGEVLRLHEAQREPAPALARRPPDAVHEELGVGRETVVHDVVQERNVDPPRREVRHHQDGHLI